MSFVYKGILWEPWGQSKPRASWKNLLKRKYKGSSYPLLVVEVLLLEVFVLPSSDPPLWLWPGGLSHLAWPAQMFHFPLNEEPQQGVPNLIEEQPENGRVRVEVGARVAGRQPQQMEQTRIASLNWDHSTRQSYSWFWGLYTVYRLGCPCSLCWTVCIYKPQHTGFKMCSPHCCLRMCLHYTT